MSLATRPPAAKVVELSVIRRDTPQASSKIYLLLDTDGRPIFLGTGRFAKVWLASEASHIETSHLLALKFVRMDAESKSVTSVARWRFFEEMLKTSQHGTSFHRGLIEYVAFGSLKGPNWEELAAQKDNIDIQSEYEFFKGLDRHLVEETCAANRKTFDEAIPGSDVDLQGDFYAMRAAHGTLEDLFILPRDWSENEIYKRKDTAAYRALNQFRIAKKENVSKLTKSFLLPSSSADINHSGFAILKNLADSRIRNRMIIFFAQSIASAVAALHSQKSLGQGYLAHRDLKLGNFLLVGDQLEDLAVTISDLGFVGGHESVAAARLTGGLNAREAYVLPPGTFPFRAPEQIQPVYEVICIIDDSSVEPDKTPMRVKLRTFTDVDLEVGDWLESPDLEFGEKGQREKRARIEEIEWNKDGIKAGRIAVCKLSCGVVSRTGLAESKGSVTKAASQHSDIFSLGAIIYFIVTGGRNPEMFWSRCVALAQSRGSTEKEAGVEDESVFYDCESFAIALCNDGGEMYKADLARLHSDKPVKPSPRWKKAITKPIAEFKKHQFVHGLTTNPSIKCLLEDMNGHRISLPIMLLILRCMLRGKPDSFVKPADGEGDKPMSAWTLDKKAGECAELCFTLAKYPSSVINSDDWLSVGPRPDQAFMALRIASSAETAHQAETAPRLATGPVVTSPKAEYSS